MKLLTILIISLFSLNADAAVINCNEAMTRFQKRNQYVQSGQNGLAQFQTFQNEFKQFVTSLNNEIDQKWIYANYFYDREAIAVSIDREQGGLTKLWDEGAWFWKVSPLRNYIDAVKQFYFDESPNLSTDLLIAMHELIMKGGPEGISNSDIGRIRTVGVHYNSDARGAFLAAANPNLRVVGRVVYYPEAERVSELLEAAIARHEAAILASNTLEQRVLAHSNFTRDFVTIHPFVNGNGRTSRFILGYLLAKDNVIPPMLEDTTELTVSEKRFFEKVMGGIKVSKSFLQDLSWRKSVALDLKESPLNLVGHLPREIWFRSKSNADKKLGFPVDLYDYSQFARKLVAKGLPSSDAATNETFVLRQYSEWLKRWSVHFKETSGSVALYQVKLIPDEYLHFWENPSTNLNSATALRVFQQQFYDAQEIHRGVSSQQSYSDEQLLHFFTDVQNIHLSMNAARQNGSLKAILGDFKAFNELMEKPSEFFAQVSDHMNAEGNYYRSLFNSTAKVPAVADRFSRGFMMSESSILQMKGELMISALRPKYGSADFNRLNEIAKKSGEVEFRSRYPRQQELAIAGSIHPSSMTRLEFRDVTVHEAVVNSGEMIAGNKTVSQIRVIERLKEDPSKVRFQVLDAARNVVSERIVSLY